MSTLSTDIQFSDVQSMLQDSAVAFCREHSPTLTVRRHLLSDTGYNAEVWASMVELARRSRRDGRPALQDQSVREQLVRLLDRKSVV